MKYDSYIALILASTFLVGCGSSGGGNPSNNQGNNNVSGNSSRNQSTSNTNTDFSDSSEKYHADSEKYRTDMQKIIDKMSEMARALDDPKQLRSTLEKPEDWKSFEAAKKSEEELRKKVQSYFQDKDFSVLYKNIRDQLLNSEYSSMLIELSDKVLEEYARDATERALKKENFSLLAPKDILKKGTTISLIQSLELEKYPISEMIKSGKFDGLFDYLKDRKIKNGTKEYTPFPAEEYDALVAQAPQKPLAAGISPDTLHRGARRGATGADATQLHINGVSGGKVDIGLPLSIHLKGNIDASKSTAGTSGTLAYKTGNTVVGVMHAYANKGNGFELGSHQAETSLAVSQSFGNMFVEAQMGYVGLHQVHDMEVSGQRYQLSLGYDTDYVTPFVQVSYRDFGALSDTAGYVGAEVSLDNLTTESYTLNLSMSAKAGYNSRNAWDGRLETSAALNTHNGLSLKGHLTLGTTELTTFGLNLDVSR